MNLFLYTSYFKSFNSIYKSQIPLLLQVYDIKQEYQAISWIFSLTLLTP